jgi:site-specific recombinase XerD
LEYFQAAGLTQSHAVVPIFRTTVRRTKRLTANAMSANDLGKMFKRRLRDAGLSLRLSPHSIRVCALTDLLQQGVPLADVQYLAGHSDPRTTRLYDRRQQRVTRNIVERISV